jgi:hypothetical protein
MVTKADTVAMTGNALVFLNFLLMRYFKNLRWYRQARKHLLYSIRGHLLPRVYVVDSFNYWSGRVRMRQVSCERMRYIREEFNAGVIVPVSFGNTTALESTIVL